MSPMNRVLSVVFCMAMLSALMPHANAATKEANVYASMYEGPNGYEQYCTENDPTGEFGYKDCVEGNQVVYVFTKKKVSLQLADDQTFVSGALYYQDNRYAPDGSPMETHSRYWDGSPAKTKISVTVDGDKITMFLKDSYVGVYDASVPESSFKG